MPDPGRYYQPERAVDYGDVIYRSTGQILEQQGSPPRIPSGTVLKHVAVKRPPIAFRTTR